MREQLRYGIQPFWFWNGTMDENEIRRQVNEMADKGIRGFFIHPRQGMEIPYLSEEYFKRVSTAVEEAKVRGLEVWLYDEYPYPSGISGGEVILDHPEFLCKELKKVEALAYGGEILRLYAPWGKVISAKAYAVKDGICDFSTYIDLEDFIGTGYQQEIFQLSGLTAYNKKRYFTGDPAKLLMWKAQEGEWKVYLFVEVVFKHFKYFENFIDPLNPDAVLYFIRTTHERYKKYLGHEFGKTIKGVFSDEVTPFPPGQPWSPLLPTRVKEMHNLDLITYLPALWEDMGEITAKVRYAYWNAATEGFINSYDKAIYRWCEENHLMYVCEKPILRSKHLKYMHVPGIDTGHQKVGSKANVVGMHYRENGKIASSAAHFYKKPATLCEAFHSIGWGMTMQDMKWTFDWLALTGVDWFVVHGYFYTTDGLKKHDAPPSAFFQMPWWKNMNVLSDYAVKLGNFLRETKRVVKILVLDPITSTWTASLANKQRLMQEFSHMQNKMLENQLDYYVIDPELLASSIIVCQDNKTLLQVGEEAYDILILPPMTNIEDQALLKIKEYASSGGKLCSFGCIPNERIENLDPLVEMSSIFGLDANQVVSNYWNHEVSSSIIKYSSDNTSYSSHITSDSSYFASNVNDFIGWLKGQVALNWKVKPLDSLGYDELPSMQSVTKENKCVLLLMNLSSKKRTVGIQWKDEQYQTIVLDPYESRWFDEGFIQEHKKDIYEINLNLEMNRKLLHKNSLRIGMWKAKFEDGQEAVVDSFPIIDQLEMSGVKQKLKQKTYFGCPKELEFVGMPVTYEFEFLCECSVMDIGEVNLVMEPGTFLGDWTIYLNGNKIIPEDFYTQFFYSHSNLAVRIDTYLKKGKNKLCIDMDTRVSFGGIRNPLYIFGDFSVRKNANIWSILPLESKGKVMDVVGGGIPFYAGSLEYDIDVFDLIGKEDYVILKIMDPSFQDAISIIVNDYKTEVCAYSPYEFHIPNHVIQPGKNNIKILLDTTAIGLFEGQLFQHEKHCYETVDE